jgi:hypothetical protein
MEVNNLASMISGGIQGRVFGHFSAADHLHWFYFSTLFLLNFFHQGRSSCWQEKTNQTRYSVVKDGIWEPRVGSKSFQIPVGGNIYTIL